MLDYAHIASEIATHSPGMVFGIPGGGPSLSLLDELEKCGVAFQLTHFEGSGVIMAATMGRLAGRAGISLSIKGPGLANAVPGLAAAWFESMPVVHLTEAAVPHAPASQAHKRMDHRLLTGAVAKGIHHFSGTDPGSQMREMMCFAEKEVPGPVVVELVECDTSERPAGSPDIGSGSCDEMLALVTAACKPVMIVGSLGIRLGLSEMLGKMRIPVFTTAAAKGVVDERLAHAAGVYTGVGGKLSPESVLLPEADLVVAIGLTAREVLSATAFGCKSISLEAVETDGMDGFGFAQRGAVRHLDAVCSALGEKQWGEEELAGARSALAHKLAEHFLPGVVYDEIGRHFGCNARAVFDTGYFCTIGEHAWVARSADLCLMSGQGRYMGTGLPMAIGAALYDREIPTVAFLGDGGVGMYLAEAKLAVQHQLPLLIVLMTDHAFGSIRTRAIKDGLTQKPLRMAGSSWVDVFAAMGISGCRAQNLTEVSSALGAWHPDSGPAFLEITFDMDLYEAMVQDIR